MIGHIKPLLVVAALDLFEADRLQPVEIEYFSEYVKNMRENRNKRFEQEFQVITCMILYIDLLPVS